MATRSDGQADGDDPPPPVSAATSGGGQSACEEAASLRNGEPSIPNGGDGVCAVVVTSPEDDTGQFSISETEQLRLGAGTPHGAEDRCDRELRALTDEVAAVRTVIERPVDADVLLRIRAWEYRETSRVEANEQLHSATATKQLVPIVPPSGEIQHDSDGESTLSRVVPVVDGVYRGQVKCSDSFARSQSHSQREEFQSDQFVPHGWGVITYSDGLRRVGQWRDGKPTGVGALESGILHYNGEWRAAEEPCGYGVGMFAFGAMFVGYWYNGRPYGLGYLQWVERSSFECGWFYGLQCLQPISVVRDNAQQLTTPRCLPSQRFKHQPYRGLFLVGKILEDARLNSLQAALEQMQRVACSQAVITARKRCWEVINASVEAHASERNAIAWDVANRIRGWRSRFEGLIDEFTAAQTIHTRVQQIREFHTNRLVAAIFQRDLARRCVASQEETVVLLEQELCEVSLLVNEAVIAQDNCRRLADSQHHVKRQIESASVKLTALQHQMRDQAKHDAKRQQQQDRKELPKTLTDTQPIVKPLHRPDQRSEQLKSESTKLRFVCDVPGCSCGIPRDVFTRVAAALNGD